MKKHLSTIIACITCIGVIVCMFYIWDLKEDISRLENNMNSYLSMIDNNHNHTLNYVEQKMAEQASLLTHFDFTAESVDVDNRTVLLRCNIIPKEHSPGVTEAVLTVNGDEFVMDLENGEYILETNIPLFEISTVSKVVFNENGTSRTEMLDWSINPRHDYLPYLNASLDGGGYGSISKNKENTYVWHREGVVNIWVESFDQPFEIKSLALVEALDGKEVNRTNIPLTNTDPIFYDDTIYESEVVYADDFDDSYSNFYHEIDHDFEIPFGSTKELYIEMVDGYGLVYRTCIEHWEIDSNGEPVDDENWYYTGLDASIYDNKGNILYDSKNELVEVY